MPEGLWCPRLLVCLKEVGGLGFVYFYLGCLVLVDKLRIGVVGCPSFEFFSALGFFFFFLELAFD